MAVDLRGLVHCHHFTATASNDTYFVRLVSVSRAAGVRSPLVALACVPAWSALLALCSAGVAVFHTTGESTSLHTIVQNSLGMQHFCVFPRSGLLVAATGSTLSVWRLATAAGPAGDAARRPSIAAGGNNRHSGSFSNSSKLPPSDVRAGSFVHVASHDMGSGVLGLTALTGPAAWQPYLHLRNVHVSWDMLAAQGLQVPASRREEAQRRQGALQRAIGGGSTPPSHQAHQGITVQLREGLCLTALPDFEQVLVASWGGFHVVQPVEGLVMHSTPFAPPQHSDGSTAIGQTTNSAVTSPQSAPGASDGWSGAGTAPSGGLGAAQRGLSGNEALRPSPAFSAEPVAGLDPPPLLQGRGVSSLAAGVLTPASLPSAAVATAWPRPSQHEALDASAAVQWLVARHIALPGRLAAAVALVAAAVLDQGLLGGAARDRQGGAAGGLLGGFNLRTLLIDDYFNVHGGGEAAQSSSSATGVPGGAKSTSSIEGKWQGAAPATVRALLGAARNILGLPAAGSGASGAGSSGRGGGGRGVPCVDAGVKTVPWEWAGCTVLHIPTCKTGVAVENAPAGTVDGSPASSKRAQFPHLTSQFNAPAGAEGATTAPSQEMQAAAAAPNTSDFQGILAAFDGSRVGQAAPAAKGSRGSRGSRGRRPPAVSEPDVSWTCEPRHMLVTQSTPLLLTVGQDSLHVHRLLPETAPPQAAPGAPPSVSLTTTGTLQAHTLHGSSGQAGQGPSFSTHGGHPMWPVPLRQGGWQSLELPPPHQAPQPHAQLDRKHAIHAPHTGHPSARPSPRAAPLSDTASVVSRSGSLRSKRSSSRVKPAHFFFNGSGAPGGRDADGASDAGSVSTASVRRGGSDMHAQQGIERILQGSLGAASRPLPISVGRSQPQYRASAAAGAEFLPSRASGSFDSAPGWTVPPSPMARGVSQGAPPPPHSDTRRAFLPNPSKATGNVRTRLVQQLPVPGLQFVLQCPVESGHRGALQHWEQRQLAARKLAKRVLGHLRVACGVARGGDGQFSDSAAAAAAGGAAAADELSGAFSDVETALEAPLSYTAAAAELGVSAKQLQAVHSAERVFLVTASGIFAAECTLPLSQVADLMTERPPNFREALWLCDAFVGTRLGGGLDHDQVRKWRERHAYERFATGAFASAFRHLWRSRHPLRRVLSLVPQLLPRGVALRRVLPHAMSVRLLMEDSLPKAMPHLLAFLGRWRAALQRQRRRIQARVLATRGPRGGEGVFVGGAGGQAQPHAGGVWRWLLSDGAAKGAVDAAERLVEQGGDADTDVDGAQADSSTPAVTLAALRDVSVWSVGAGPAAFILPESIQAQGPLEFVPGRSGDSSAHLGAVHAAVQEQKLQSVLGGDEGGGMPPSITLGSAVALSWLVDTCLVYGLVWQWLHCQSRLELAARVAATEAVIRKMAPEQLAAFQDRVNSSSKVTSGSGKRSPRHGSQQVKSALLALKSRGGAGGGAPPLHPRGSPLAGMRSKQAAGSSWDEGDGTSIMSGSVSGGLHLGRGGQASALASSLARAGGLPISEERQSHPDDDVVSLPDSFQGRTSAFSDSGSDEATVVTAVSGAASLGGGRLGSVRAASTVDASSQGRGGWQDDWDSSSIHSTSSSDSGASLAASWASLDSLVGLQADTNHGHTSERSTIADDTQEVPHNHEAAAFGSGLPDFDLRFDRGADPLWASFHEEHNDSNGATANRIATAVMAPFIAGVRTSAMYVVAASALSAATRAASSELHSPTLSQQRQKCSLALFRLLNKPNSAEFSEVAAALSRSRQWRQLCAMLRAAGQHRSAVAVLVGVLSCHSKSVQAAKDKQQALQLRIKQLPQSSLSDGSLLGKAAAQATQQCAVAVSSSRRSRMRLLRALVGYLRKLGAPNEQVVFASLAPLLGEQLKMVGVTAALSVFRKRRGEYNVWLRAGPNAETAQCSGVLNPYAIACFLLTGRTGAALLPAAHTLNFISPGAAPPAWSVAVPETRMQVADGASSPQWDGQLAAMAFLEHLVEFNSAPPAVHMALARLYLQCMQPLLQQQRPAHWLRHMASAERQLQSMLLEMDSSDAPASVLQADRSVSLDSDGSAAGPLAALQCVWSAPNPGEETHALLHRLRVRFLHFLNSSAALNAAEVLHELHLLLERVQGSVLDAVSTSARTQGAHLKSNSALTAQGSGSGYQALHSLSMHGVLWDLAPERVALHSRLQEHRTAVEILAFHQRDLQGAVTYADSIAGDALYSANGAGVSLDAVNECGTPAAGPIYDALVGGLQLAQPLQELHDILGRINSDPHVVLLGDALRDWEATCKRMSLSALPGRARFLDGTSLLQHSGTNSTVADVQDVLVALLTASATRASGHTLQVGMLHSAKRCALARCMQLQSRLSKATLRALENKAMVGATEVSTHSVVHHA